MQYLTEDDLTSDSYKRFINESTGDGNDVLDKNEKRAIAIVTTYISDLYDTRTIFGYTIPAQDDEDQPVVVHPVRDEFLIDLIAKITLYKVFRRNAARKVPEDVQEDWEWAIKQLERINSGRVTLSLPGAVDDNTGETESYNMWGNLSDPNFYI